MEEFWLQMIDSIKSMGSPLRPETSEVRLVERSIAGHQARLRKKPGQALLLGVTEEIVTMDWPEEVFLESVDQSDPMIQAFWRDDLPGKRRLRRTNWWEMDQSFGPYRYAIGDGVFNIQPYPDRYAEFAKKLHSLMEPGGHGYFRVFCQRGDNYSVEEVLRQYRAGQLKTFQQLRFCFGIAMQRSTEEGCALNIPSAVESLADHGIALRELEQLPDFEAVAGPMMKVKDPHSLKLYYPTAGEFEEAVRPWFTVRETGYGNHPLARLCPTFFVSRK